MATVEESILQDFRETGKPPMRYEIYAIMDHVTRQTTKVAPRPPFSTAVFPLVLVSLYPPSRTPLTPTRTVLRACSQGRVAPSGSLVRPAEELSGGGRKGGGFQLCMDWLQGTENVRIIPVGADLFVWFGPIFHQTAAMGGVFAASECIAKQVRQEDDPWNSAIAGCAAGLVAGIRAHSIPTMCIGCAAIGGTFAAYEYVSGNLKGVLVQMSDDDKRKWRQSFFKKNEQKDE
ncbi:LOW QUALITY PROTEIN: hypothetical protein BC937DRAFT_89448 [Endogone sp. FLAS-F59071]|nr:LOW QUALITY PROTEIN: hypothetical protein BC937DRAFT_89448 [Endogone sp. FLAS-F59071]|eukprot:RUS22400.1 LOW QUALITY PROTEIN: hypothetical protein BC937DRAFT_89448 [Endogone sp. FLAS-F59071]